MSDSRSLTAGAWGFVALGRGSVACVFVAVPVSISRDPAGDSRPRHPHDGHGTCGFGGAVRVRTPPWDTPTAILHSFLLLSWVSSLRHGFGKWGRCLFHLGLGQRHGHAAFDQENVRCNFGIWLMET